MIKWLKKVLKLKGDNMNNKLYIGNLNWNATEGDIETEFANYGEVTQVKIVTDRETQRSRGFAFVTFADPKSAQAAMDGLNERDFMGRQLRVSFAEERKSQGYQPRGRGDGAGYTARGYR